jgi:hypothetical protein
MAVLYLKENEMTEEINQEIEPLAHLMAAACDLSDFYRAMEGGFVPLEDGARQTMLALSINLINCAEDFRAFLKGQ